MIRFYNVWPLTATACALLLLAACAPVRIRGTSEQIAAQVAREQSLGTRTHWSLQAHFAVSDGRDGGSGSLAWQQAGDDYSMTLRAPITGKSARLQGGPDGVVLTGVRKQPIRGDDAQSLLSDEFGWYIPVAQLTWWVRGLRAPDSPADVRYGKDGLPSLLKQDGWEVQYLDWYSDRSPPLPRRVFADKPPYSVRVLIEQWQMP